LIPNLRIYDLKKLTANEKPPEGVEDFDNIPK